MQLDKKFFSKSADKVAKELLGKILIRKLNGKFLKAKITETEAYFGSEDPASRAVQNGDLRQTMLMEAGTILVYGVHNNWLINFVTNDKGKAEAVLIRALEPLNFNANTKGPGLLTKALKINKIFHKENICNEEDIWIENNNEKFRIIKSFRIGVKKDLKKKLRFYIKDNKYISRK
ncbi:MAG: DNA-3-methyladenine glycosylase [Nanoarchaeota archaeon]